jgi:hypothetical protein
MNAQPILDVTPKVFAAGAEASVTLRVAAPGAPGPLRVRLQPAEGEQGRIRHPETPELTRVPAAGAVSVRCSFPTEQEYFFLLESLSGAAPVVVAEATVYALRRDLFDRLPWKGDLHIHSRRSDGLDEPYEVVAACRRIGLDFMALTDHAVYEPSLEAIRAFEGCPTDLTMLPGEEVHPPGCPVHIVNAGGSRSANAAFTTERYRHELEAVTAEVSADAGPELGSAPHEDLEQYAATLWSFREIRSSGGLGIFCHPSWVTGGRYDVPGALTDMIFARQPFDALELIGGYQIHEAVSNDLQVARWADERARGARIPVVGVSDAHGCNNGKLFGWYYTVAFSPAPAWSALLPAILGEWSVAVEARPGEVPRVFGPYRLVMFAHFLLREVFPRHDELCAAEAEPMLRWARGDRSGTKALEARRGEVRALYRELWARR